jgi:acetylglutamate kinase
VALQGTVESAEAAPTSQSATVFEVLNAKLEAQLNAWHEIESKDLAALNTLIQKSNIPAIAPAAEKSEGDSK